MSTVLTASREGLKEWAVAVRALAEGRHIVLLRKGGIREEGKRFHVAHRAFWLYPTFEHQQPALVQPAYHDLLGHVLAESRGPRTVRIEAWAEVTHAFAVRDAETVEALTGYHLWTGDYAAERLRWQPKQPLHVLLLRVARLPEPVELPLRAEYGGCRSWVELERPLETAPAQPVLDAAAYAARTAELGEVLRRAEPIDADRREML
ncbi:MAG: DUF1802 family protein [Chloroflexi bacterium]|nr:DUF1802 family protein [Chloroflexota bacterium]